MPFIPLRSMLHIVIGNLLIRIEYMLRLGNCQAIIMNLLHFIRIKEEFVKSLSENFIKGNKFSKCNIIISAYTKSYGIGWTIQIRLEQFKSVTPIVTG